MAPLRVIRSSLDPSVNFIQDIAPGQAFESRHVLRDPHRLICYLSCQTACSAGCKFCHLTATGQTVARDATVYGLVEQARRVLVHHATLPEGVTTREVSFSFMARGEPLLSRTVFTDWPRLSAALAHLADAHGYAPRFKISTIMPRRALGDGGPLPFCDVPRRPRIYWSCYSAGTAFRKHWMPAAVDVSIAAALLAEYLDHGGEITLHHAVIEHGPDHPGNSRPEDLEELFDALRPSGLLEGVRFNLVRYNPPPGANSQEASREALDARLQALRAVLGPDRVQEVRRVGPDAYASCGMFPVADA